MKQQKRQKILYAVFVLAVLWGLYMQPWKRRKREAPPPTPTEQKTQAAVTAAIAGTADNRMIIPVDLEWPANPFRPATEREPDEIDDPGSDYYPDAPMLQGTMVVDGVEVCVLGGKVYHSGDHCDTWRIARIAGGEVVLIGPNQERVTLRPQESAALRSENAP
jgi:hypothetical protein